MIDIIFGGCAVTLLGSGAMLLANQSTLCVSDLHLGKSERVARRTGQLFPPYENLETLSRLEQELEVHNCKQVICLGDSFDDLDAMQDLPESDALWLTRLMAGRRWIWIEGNHDPGPINLGGSHLESVQVARIEFRHIASPSIAPQISGHFHPKARVNTGRRNISRACFVVGKTKIIMPAFGTYTGGLSVQDPVIATIFDSEADVVLTGNTMARFPFSALR
ncbi:MAG: DNA ligase-associated metallophosphoesterase [Paracoccaceae bacterium]|jgi:DNA ligase-associated metallophosphoesterase